MWHCFFASSHSCIYVCVHMQVLMVPQLTLLAAALMPWPMLLQLVEGAVAAAQQVLFTKVCL